LPTFWEFVQWFLLRPENSFSNEHWNPVFSFCSPCTINYNYILKFESLSEDEENLRQVWNTEAIHSVWENRNDHGLSKDEVTLKYFKLLDKQDVEKLYEVYKMDFKMFNYSAAPYLDL